MLTTNTSDFESAISKSLPIVNDSVDPETARRVIETVLEGKSIEEQFPPTTGLNMTFVEGIAVVAAATSILKNVVDLIRSMNAKSLNREDVVNLIITYLQTQKPDAQSGEDGNRPAG